MIFRHVYILFHERWDTPCILRQIWGALLKYTQNSIILGFLASQFTTAKIVRLKHTQAAWICMQRLDNAYLGTNCSRGPPEGLLGTPTE